MDVQDCVAVVTGGASGLGEATVRNIVAHGRKTIIFDLQKENGLELATEFGENVRFISIDVTDESSVQVAIEEAVQMYGKVNTLVNCAGVAIAKRTVSKKGAHDLESFSKVIQVNLVGSFNVIRLLAERSEEHTSEL